MTAQRQDTGTRRLSAGAIHLLDLLRGYCQASLRTRGQAVADVSQERLAERLHRSLPQVRRYVLELVKHNLITVSRGYRARNYYEVSDSNRSPVSGSNISSMSDSNRSPVSGSNISSMSGSGPAPLSIDLGLTQQRQAAAVESPLPSEPAATPQEAQTALENAGIPAPAARKFASADPALCLFALAFYQAEAAAKRPEDALGVGFLRDCLKHPEEYGLKKKDGAWTAPKEAQIYKSLKDALAAVKADEQKARDRRRIAESDERSRLAELAAPHDEADWLALPDDERRAIERVVAGETRPGTTLPAYVVRGRCYAKMRAWHTAIAREQQWQALPIDERNAVDAETRTRFPILTASPTDFHSACLTVMVARHTQRRGLTSPKGP